MGNRQFVPWAVEKGLQPFARSLPGDKFLGVKCSCLFICSLRFWEMLVGTRYTLHMKIIFITNFTVSILPHEMGSLKVKFSCSKRVELG